MPVNHCWLWFWEITSSQSNIAIIWLISWNQERSITPKSKWVSYAWFARIFYTKKKSFLGKKRMLIWLPLKIPSQFLLPPHFCSLSRFWRVITILLKKVNWIPFRPKGKYRICAFFMCGESLYESIVKNYYHKRCLDIMY